MKTLLSIATLQTLILAIAASPFLPEISSKDSQQDAALSFWDEPVPVYVKTIQDLNRAPPVQFTLKRTDIETRWLEQPLDHFDKSINHIWNQRILINDEYFQEGGPILIYIGGEWKIDGGPITAGIWVDIAKEHNGTLVYTEHRYYGESIPTPNLTTANLKYQNVKQSLADLAGVIDQLKNSEKRYANAKVVVSGCSYSATMAVLFRKLYPDHSVGSWASSAPLKAVVNFKEYMEVVGKAFSELGNEKCYNRIQNATAFYEELLNTGRHEDLRKILKLCDDFDESNEKDVWTLFSSIAYTFANLVQYQRPGEIDYYCRLLANWSEDDATAVAEFIYWQFKRPKCVNTKYKNTINYYKWSMNNIQDSGLAWVYQTCKEFGWYSSSASPNQPFGTSFPVTLNLDICKDVFGSKFTSAAIELSAQLTNQEFGGKNAAVNNTYQTHGGLDPWHVVGAGIAQGAFIIPKACHCSDQGSISLNDSPALIKSKKHLIKLVRQWLA